MMGRRLSLGLLLLVFPAAFSCLTVPPHIRREFDVSDWKEPAPPMRDPAPPADAGTPEATTQPPAAGDLPDPSGEGA